MVKKLVIIPAYNEEENITELILDILKNEIEGLDIVVINDCSTDGTSKKCKQLHEPSVAIIDLPCNLGIGGAMQTGYKYALKNDYDIAIQVDGDGQHKPEFIKLLIGELSNGADMVIGSRFITKVGFQSTVYRRMGIKYFSSLINILSRSKITDPTSGFRACNKKVIAEFAHKYPTDYPEPESIVFLTRNHYKIKEVPVMMKERVGGVSSIRSFRSAYYMIKVSLAIFIDLLRKRTALRGRV